METDNKQLGDWESKQYDGIIYVQSGVYWKRLDSDCEYCVYGDCGSPSWSKVKVRGFGTGDLQLSHVLGNLDSLTTVQAHTHRFAGLAGFHSRPEFTQWLDGNSDVQWGGSGKRIHDPDLCPKCNGAPIQLHPLRITTPSGGKSTKHVLAWRKDNNELMENVYQAVENENSGSLIQLQPSERMEQSFRSESWRDDLLRTM